MHTSNSALIDMINSNQPLNTPAKKWVMQLTKSAERLFAGATILERGMNDIQKTISNRKHQASGKRRVIKGQHVMTRPEMLNGIL